MDTTTTQSQGLDPQAVQLAQSIRQVESGGDFTAKGGSGEYGAYQWMPDTWNAESQAAGVNVPLDQATPEEQNQVAYTKIKQLKNQGYNVGQIASIWNSGDPNAYQTQTPGVNAEGVSYNTPQYAQSVAQTYQTIKNGGAITSHPLGAPVSSLTSGDGAPGSNLPSPGSWFIPAVLGLGSVGLAAATGGTSILPEALGGAAAEEGGAGVLGAIGNAAKNFATSKIGTLAEGAGLGSIPGIISNLTGGSQAAATNTAGQEEANATAQAGTEEAQATQQAATEQAQEQEDVADASRATNQIAGTMNQALQQTQSGRILSQSPDTQTGIQANAQYGIVPSVENGIFNSSEALKKSQSTVGELSDGIAQVLDQEGGTGSLADVQKAAYENIEKYVPTQDRAAARKAVDENLQAYNNEYGGGTGSISLGNMERGKKEQYAAAGKWDATKTTAQKAAHKALGTAFRGHIYDKTKHKDLYSRAMKEEAALLKGQKVLKHLNGKKAPEHKGFTRGILSHYGKYVGTAIGDKIGGPIGAVVGTMIGEHVTKAVDKRFGKTYFESKEGKKMIELLSKKSPKIAKEVKNELTRFGIKAEELKKELQKPERQLPSGRGVIPGTTIRLSAPTTIEKQAETVRQYNTKKGRPTLKGTLGEFVRQQEKEKTDAQKKEIIQKAKQSGIKTLTQKQKEKKRKIVRGLPIIR